MNGIDDAIWSALASEKLRAGEMAARPAVPHLTTRLLAAIGRDRRRHLLIALSPEENEYADSSSRGLRVETKDLDAGNLPRGRYLDLECSEATGYEAFDIVGYSVAELLHEPGLSPADAVAEVLARWRRFWGQTPSSMLSDEALLGLYGEIWFLTYWLIPACGVNVVRAWKGPAGSRHDFQMVGTSVEVKTTTSTRGRIHRIHGIEQLRLPDNAPLYLFSLRLRNEPSATNTLPQIIEACTQQIKAHTDLLDLFEQDLIAVGYSPIHLDHYGEYHFQIVEEALFQVRDDFPRITEEILSAGALRGVETIEYTVNLNAYDHLCVARIPEQLGSLGWDSKTL